MKVISFSLWGNSQNLLDGAWENLLFAKLYYPGWTCRLYVERSVVPKASQLHVEGFDIHARDLNPSWGSHQGLFWRYESAFDPTVTRSIFRDLDKRLNPREAAAVREWEKSDKLVHVMRDWSHKDQCVPGGLWGIKHAPWLEYRFDTWEERGKPGDDQRFLRNAVWPALDKNDVLTHSFYSQAETSDTWGQHIVQPFPPHEPLNSTIHGAYCGGLPVKKGEKPF